MKYINPEKSCILDVSESRADELERAGWTLYSEPTAPVNVIEKKYDNKPQKTAAKKTAGKSDKGKKK